MKINSTNSILAAFCADAHALGAHWVYDESDLKKISFDWSELNAPQSLWHKGKNKGDFTHYGDQTFFLLEFMQENKIFDKEKFYEFWKSKMSSYDGYIDGASRESMNSMGSASNDLSICGRITPLLLQDLSKEAFLQNVNDFVSITHNSDLAKTASAFFAELLWISYENNNIKENIQTLKSKYPSLKSWIDEAVVSGDKDTFTTIREFGPACGIDGGFAGVIHLLSLDDDFETIMIKNVKAGGDSSARGMVVAMILATQNKVNTPQNWIDDLNHLKNIRQFLSLSE